MVGDKKVVVMEETADQCSANRQLSNLSNIQQALANLGAGVRPNLLGNAYFVGGEQLPINQAGETSWTGSASYVALFDRWFGYYTGGGVTFSITSDGVVIPVTSSYASILQRLLQPNSSMAGKTYTVSAIVGGELISATGEVTAVSSEDSTVFITATGSNGCIVRLRYSPTHGMFFEVYTPNGGVTVEYCKLEENIGQTLAYQDSTGAWQLLPQPDIDYTTQLLRCQQYQIALSQYFVAPAVNFSTDYIDFSIPIPIQMRTIPVVNQNDFYVGTDTMGAQSGFSFSVTAISSNAIRLRATKKNHGVNFSSCARIEVSSERTILNANL